MIGSWSQTVRRAIMTPIICTGQHVSCRDCFEKPFPDLLVPRLNFNLTLTSVGIILVKIDKGFQLSFDVLQHSVSNVLSWPGMLLHVVWAMETRRLKIIQTTEIHFIHWHELSIASDIRKSKKTKRRESDQSREKERFFFIFRDKNVSLLSSNRQPIPLWFKKRVTHRQKLLLPFERLHLFSLENNSLV